MSYDTAITTFSPNGQLLQVEYALEAVKIGNCTIGFKTKDHVILAVEKKVTKKLQDTRSFKKICLIDHHIVSAFTGLGADSRVVVNRARIEAQQFKLNYDDLPSVDFISKKISSLMQKYTQTGGARPFGMSIMVAGINKNGEVRLNQIDPSGMITGYKANAIGKNQKQVVEFLEKHYKEEASLEEGLKIVAKCLANNIDNPKKNSEFCIVGKEGIRFLSNEELEDLYKQAEAE